MRFPLTMLPSVITSIVEAKVSLERLNKFLLGKELDASAVTKLPASSDEPAVEMKSIISILLTPFFQILFQRQRPKSLFSSSPSQGAIRWTLGFSFSTCSVYIRLI